MADSAAIRSGSMAVSSGCFPSSPSFKTPLSPSRASSPARIRNPSPLRTTARKDLSPAAPLRQSSASPRSSTGGIPGAAPRLGSRFASSGRKDSASASGPGFRRQREQGLVPRQPLAGPVLTRHVCASVKFPGATEEETERERPSGGGVPEVSSSGRDQEGEEEEEEVEEEEEGEKNLEASQPKSSLDRVELQARQSLSKLKHLLYKLKTRRDGDVRSSVTSTPVVGDGTGEGRLMGEEQQIFVSQKIEVDLSSPLSSVDIAEENVDAAGSRVSAVEPSSGLVSSLPSAKDSKMDLASLKDGLEMQLDALTATRATVKFDDVTKTAVVTVTATVRSAEFLDTQTYSERAIAMAARALARTCLELDDKAQTAVLSASAATSAGSSSSNLNLPGGTPSAASSAPHQKAQRALLSGAVESWVLASSEFGCTPFRPVYLVKLRLVDGSLVDALYKPCVPGDKFLRWKRAPEDWVAYQLSCMLGMDTAPPAVIRSGVTLGEKQFDLGVMVLKPASLVRLENADPYLLVSRSGASTPDAVVANVRILDMLLGNAMRQKDSFLAGVGHWVAANTSAGNEGGFQPITLSQPMGPRLGGAIHSMWTATNGSGTPLAIQVISAGTLAKLRVLSHASLLDVFGGVLSTEEIEAILVKRDHLLAYFEGVSRKLGWSKICI